MLYYDEQIIEVKSVVETFGSRQVFQIADRISDTILFHKKVRENATKKNDECME